MRHVKSGEFRKTKLPFYPLVGTVSNCAYSVLLQTAPTGGEGVYLFFESTIVLIIMLRCEAHPPMKQRVSDS